MQKQPEDWEALVRKFEDTVLARLIALNIFMLACLIIYGWQAYRRLSSYFGF